MRAGQTRSAPYAPGVGSQPGIRPQNGIGHPFRALRASYATRLRGLLTSAAHDVSVAAVLTRFCPRLQTVLDAEQGMREDSRIVRTAFEANNRFRSAFLGLDIAASLATLVFSDRAGPDPRNRPPVLPVQARAKLRGALRSALLNMQMLAWEDLALPHRALPKQARITLATARRKLLSARWMLLWLR